MPLQIQVSSFQLAVRAAAGAGISVALAELLELDHPLYAMLAAVIVTDLAPSETRLLGLRRLVATMVGAGCGALLGRALPTGPWSVALSIFVAMLVCYLIRASQGARVAGYICGIVVLAHASESWTYAFHRFVETALGVVVAWLISLVPKLLASGDERAA